MMEILLQYTTCSVQTDIDLLENSWDRVWCKSGWNGSMSNKLYLTILWNDVELYDVDSVECCKKNGLPIDVANYNMKCDLLDVLVINNECSNWHDVMNSFFFS